MDRGRQGPPDRGFRGYGGPGAERRRSRSPPDRRGRSPPPFRRHRRDNDPYFDRFNSRDDFPRPRGSPRYDDYPEDRRERSPVGERVNQGPLSFKQFLLNQSDDPSPDEAQERYRQYLVEYHGSEIKAEFMQTRNDERVRAMFDPRLFEKALLKRNADALESASRFNDDFSTGALDPSASGFNQGAGELAPKPPAVGAEGAAAGAEGGDKKAAEPVTYTPMGCWRPSRIASDIVLARRLIRKLDWEKNITNNVLLPPKPAEPSAAEQEAQAADAKDAAAAKEEGKDGPTGTARRYVETDDEAPVVDPTNLDFMAGQLDQLLTYLWRVHGVDYYSGYELTAAEFSQRLTACRLLRGPKPEEGEQAGTDAGSGAGGSAMAGVEGAGAEGAAAAGAAGGDAAMSELVAAVDEGWARRISEGDPLEARCLRKKVEELLDKWIDSQIVCHSDSKWGSQLSTKLFVARKFVVKHIRTKHDEKLQVEKERILDELYFENFKSFKEEEARAAEVAGKGAAAGEGAEGEGQGAAGGAGGFRGGRGGRFGAMARGGRFGMMGRGRGRGMMGMNPMMSGMMDMAMMGMPMGGPMIIPPGAAPFMPMPIMPGMPMPFMAPGMMMGAAGARGRGARGAMGGMMRGRGGRFGALHMAGPGAKLDPAGIREYYDLDNPQNNRAVLDYGDL